jgi:hypothetical protein
MVTIVTTLMFTKSYYPTCRHFFGSNTLINKHGWHYSEKLMHVSSATINNYEICPGTFHIFEMNPEWWYTPRGTFQGGLKPPHGRSIIVRAILYSWRFEGIVYPAELKPWICQLLKLVIRNFAGSRFWFEDLCVEEFAGMFSMIYGARFKREYIYGGQPQH